MGHNDRVPPELTAHDLSQRRLFIRPIQLAFTIATVLLGIIGIIFSLVGLGSGEPSTTIALWADALIPALITLPLFVWIAPRSVLCWAVPLIWLVSLGTIPLPRAWASLSIASLLALLWLTLRPMVGRSTGPRVLPSGHRPVKDSYAIGSSQSGWIGLAVGVVLAGVLVGWAWLWLDGPMGAPSSSVTIAGIVVPLFVWVSTIQLARSHRRLRLVRRGAPAFRIRVVGWDNSRFLIPVDVVRPNLEIVDLEEVLDGKVTRAFNEWVEARMDAEADAEDASTIPPDDEALLGEWADRQDPLEGTDDEPEGWEDPRWLYEYDHWDAVAEKDGPDVGNLEPFTLVGAPMDGAVVALVRADGRTWLGGLRERWPSAQRATTLTLVMDGTPPDREPEGGPLITELKGVDRAWGWTASQPAIRWGWPFLIALVAGPLVPWAAAEDAAAGEGGVGTFVFLALVAAAIIIGTSARAPEVRPSRRGIRRMGFFVDHRLDRDRVAHVAAGQHAVALRLRDPAGAIVVPACDIGTEDTADRFAARLQAALDNSPDGARSTWQPSPALWALVLLLLAWAALIPSTIAA